MIFDWDEANIAHLARHKVSAVEAESLFSGPLMDISTESDDEDELRIRVGGQTHAGRVLELVFTYREDATRVVSAWDAPKHVKVDYLGWRVRDYGG